jgi:hypothetical protein
MQFMRKLHLVLCSLCLTFYLAQAQRVPVAWDYSESWQLYGTNCDGPGNPCPGLDNNGTVINYAAAKFDGSRDAHYVPIIQLQNYTSTSLVQGAQKNTINFTFTGTGGAGYSGDVIALWVRSYNDNKSTWSLSSASKTYADANDPGGWQLLPITTGTVISGNITGTLNSYAVTGSPQAAAAWLNSLSTGGAVSHGWMDNGSQYANYSVSLTYDPSKYAGWELLASLYNFQTTGGGDNYMDEGFQRLGVLPGINKSQSVSITPITSTIQLGQSVTFTASAKDANGNDISSTNGGYTWTGLDGLSGTTGAATATGTTTTQAVTFNTVGTYTVTVSSPGNSSYSPSNTAKATVTVNPATTLTANIGVSINGGPYQPGPGPYTISVGQTATITINYFTPLQNNSINMYYYEGMVYFLPVGGMDLNSISSGNSNMVNYLNDIWALDNSGWAYTVFGTPIDINNTYRASTYTGTLAFSPTSVMVPNSPYTFAVYGQGFTWSDGWSSPVALNTPSGSAATLTLKILGAPTPYTITATVNPKTIDSTHTYQWWFAPKSLSQVINVQKP